MSSHHSHLKQVCFLLILSAFISLLQDASNAQDKPRGIVSDDFTNARPKSKTRRPGKSRPYRLASAASGKTTFGEVQIGLTIWKLQSARFSYSGMAQFRSESDRGRSGWIETRVEADTPFHEGDLLRLSIESPRAGYLYVVNRDWLTDGSAGKTNLIFPTRGEDNYLVPGKLIDIPAEYSRPFKASPAPNQTGELLTIIVTSSPLPLILSKGPLPISSSQLFEWEQRWSGLTNRFEMIDGAGQYRTKAEDNAASGNGTRQLTRDDPSPQTIYVLTPKNRDGLLFDLMLSYAR